MRIRQAQMKSDMKTIRSAGLRLLRTYVDLSNAKRHLLDEVLEGQKPQQWAHYPSEDAIDVSSGYQWFYHSHSPEDRPEGLEHGHIHLFARRPLWSRRLQSRSEIEFRRVCGSERTQTHTTHLLSIGLNAKGLPITLFTVNSWVTGDEMLSTKLTMQLLASIQLKTGHPKVDAVIESVVHLCLPEIESVLQKRDAKLASFTGANKLQDLGLELLSELPIDLDEKLKRLM
jgi:hypothetical protein